MPAILDLTVPGADVVSHDDTVVAAQLVHDPLDDVHALAVRRHVHVRQRVVAGLVAEQVPLQVAACLRQRPERVELGYRPVEVTHDDASDVSAGLVQDLKDLHRRSLVPARVDEYRCAALLLCDRRRSQRLELVVGQRPRASDLADDACAHAGSDRSALDVLDDPSDEVILGA